MNYADCGLLPQERLLRACAVSGVEDAGSETIASLLSSAEINWPELVVQSIRHGITPIVARHLRGFAHILGGIPHEALACLDRIYHANGRRNQVLFRETARLTRALKAAGIDCLLLKGVALALTVYPEAALRNFADVDILVREGDFEAAGQIAQACGFEREALPSHPRTIHVTYTARCAEDILTDTLAPEYDPRVTPEILAHSRSLVKVEMHRNLFCIGSLAREVDTAPFWECPQSAFFPDGTPFLLPSPEMMLVHLCEHAAHHHFKRLLFPIDVARVLQAYGTRLDWERAAAISSHSGVGKNVARMLEFTRREFGAQVPQEALERFLSEKRINRNRPPLRSADIFRTMQMRDRDLLYAKFFAHLGATRSLRELLTSCRDVVFPPIALMEATYGSRSPLGIAGLYLYRPFLLAARLALMLCRRWKRNMRAAGWKGTNPA